MQDCKFFEDQSLQSLKCVGGKYGFAAVSRINKKIDVWRMEEGLRYSKFQSFSANIPTRVHLSLIVVKSYMKQVVKNTSPKLVWFDPDISYIIIYNILHVMIHAFLFSKYFSFFRIIFQIGRYSEQIMRSAKNFGQKSST